MRIGFALSNEVTAVIRVGNVVAMRRLDRAIRDGRRAACQRQEHTRSATS